MRAVLRSLPVFAPTEVSTITGLPRRSPPSSPFVASYSSACLCAQADVLGSYSPVSGMAPFSRCCADCVNGWYLTRSFGLHRGRDGARLDTRLLYEEGPHRQGHDSLVVTSALTSVTVRRIVDGIEQRPSLYGLLREGQGHVGGCSGGPIPSRVVKRPEASWGLPGQTVHSCLLYTSPS